MADKNVLDEVFEQMIKDHPNGLTTEDIEYYKQKLVEKIKKEFDASKRRRDACEKGSVWEVYHGGSMDAFEKLIGDTNAPDK